MNFVEPESTIKKLSKKSKLLESLELNTNPECSKRQLQPAPVLSLSASANKCWRLCMKYTESGPLELPEGFETTPLSIADSQSDLVCLQSSHSTLEIAEDGSALCIRLSNGAEIFSNPLQSFFAHEQQQKVYEGLQSLKVTDFSSRAPFSPQGETYDSYMRRFRYPLPKGAVLGLPGQSGEWNRRGYRFELYNTDTFLHLPDRRPLYQSWPITIHQVTGSSRWVAVYLNNPTRMFVDIGDFYKDSLTFEALAGDLDVYICFADSLPELTQELSLLLGESCFPPLWAFGYQQCRWSYMSEKEVKSVAKNFRQHDIPLDALYLDIDYMDEFRVFTNNPHTFTDIPALVRELHEQDIKVVPIVDPGVKRDEKYGIYNELLEQGEVLTRNREGGEPFEAKVWPGNCVMPDFFSEKTQSFWSSKQSAWMKEHHFDGIWNDMNEPSNFDGANANTEKAYTSKGPMREVYNLYGKKMAQASARGCSEYDQNKRFLVISRSGYPGIQKHAVIWHGDNQAWWEHLRLALNTAVTYSLCGAHYTGADVPGFTGNAPADLAVRFFQLGSFLPLFRGHSIYFAEDKEPYVYPEPFRTAIVNAIRLRYSLLREWYSSFEHTLRSREPLMMPTFDGDTLVQDQFLLFSKLLVAPILQRDQKQRLIYLPEGTWYRLGETDEKIKGGRYIIESVELETVPVFVRAGTILTRNKVAHCTKATIENQELFEVYLSDDQTASGYWYNDDGTSVNTDMKRYELFWDSGSSSVSRNTV